MNSTIMVDFDHVIHRAEIGRVDDQIYDFPVEGAKEALFTMIDNGFDPVIFTARDPSMFPKMKAWLKKNRFPDLEITNTKRRAIAYIDDRTIRFTNWPDMLRYFIA